MAGRFTVEAVFKAVDKITAPVSRFQNRVLKFTRSATRGFRKLERVTSKISSSIKKGIVGTTAAIAGLAVAIKDVTTVGAEFGRAIGSAAAKFPGQIKRGTEEFKALEDAAREVGKTTEFTAVQAAQGLNFLAKAGFEAQFATKALPEIIDFATAAELDFATAADIASDAIGAFGLDSENLGKKMTGLRRVMDVMSLTANRTNTSVEELFEAAKKGAPIASAAGVSIETFSAAMGFLASNGIKATEAGTAAKNITLALAGVGNKAAATFKRLGISLQDNNGNLRDQFDVLDDLRGSLKELGQQEQVEVLAAIFGKIPLAAATKLVSESGKSVRGLREELENAGGSSKRTAAFIRDDVKGSMDSLTSAIEGVKVSIFTLNEGPLKDTIDRMTLWVRENEKVIASGIAEFVTWLMDNLPSVVKWLKRIGIAIGVFFAFNAILKTLITTLTAVNLVMAANPIGLVVVGIAALVAAIAAVIIWWDDLKAVLLRNIEAWKLVGMFFADFWQDVKARFTDGIGFLIKFPEIIKNAFKLLVVFFANLWDQIANIFEERLKRISDVIGKVRSTISAVTDKAGAAAEAVSSTVSDAMSSIGSMFNDDEEEGTGTITRRPPSTIAPQIVSPQERIASFLEERNTTSSAEVTIRDETGRAQVTDGSLGNGIALESSGTL